MSSGPYREWWRGKPLACLCVKKDGPWDQLTSPWVGGVGDGLAANMLDIQEFRMQVAPMVSEIGRRLPIISRLNWFDDIKPDMTVVQLTPGAKPRLGLPGAFGVGALFDMAMQGLADGLNGRCLSRREIVIRMGVAGLASIPATAAGAGAALIAGTLGFKAVGVGIAAIGTAAFVDWALVDRFKTPVLQQIGQ